MNVIKYLILVVSLAAPVVNASQGGDGNNPRGGSFPVWSTVKNYLHNAWMGKQILSNKVTACLGAFGIGVLYCAHKYCKPFRNTVSLPVIGHTRNYFNNVRRGDKKTLALTGAALLVGTGIIFRKQICSGIKSFTSKNTKPPRGPNNPSGQASENGAGGDIQPKGTSESHERVSRENPHVRGTGDQAQVQNKGGVRQLMNEELAVWLGEQAAGMEQAQQELITAQQVAAEAQVAREKLLPENRVADLARLQEMRAKLIDPEYFAKVHEEGLHYATYTLLALRKEADRLEAALAKQVVCEDKPSRNVQDSGAGRGTRHDQAPEAKVVGEVKQEAQVVQPAQEPSIAPQGALSSHSASGKTNREEAARKHEHAIRAAQVAAESKRAKAPGLVQKTWNALLSPGSGSLNKVNSLKADVTVVQNLLREVRIKIKSLKTEAVNAEELAKAEAHKSKLKRQLNELKAKLAREAKLLRVVEPVYNHVTNSQVNYN